MSWAKTILGFLKYVLAPILAYFKGRKDEKVANIVRAIKTERAYNEKNRAVRKKYERIRATAGNVVNLSTVLSKKSKKVTWNRD